MKRTKTKHIFMGALSLAFISITVGCSKDLYDPETNAKELPAKENFFDFNLTQNVQLNVNYGIPGLTTIIEVYDQDPMEDAKTKKADIIPVYVAYVNNGKYEGIMNIPTAVKDAYLYSNSISVVKCIKLKATVTGFEYDATIEDQSKTRVNTSYGPAAGLVDGTNFPHEVAAENGGKRQDNLYSISKWNAAGWALTPNYYTLLRNIGKENEEIGTVSNRINAFLTAQQKVDKNASLLREPEQINLKVPATATDGMSIELTHMGENCSFFNTFGYYYYEDKGRTLTPEEFLKIKKYIAIPRAQTHAWGTSKSGAVAVGETVKLLYFDENGQPSEKFPAGYVIGWFLIANGFGSNPPALGTGGDTNGGRIKDLPVDAYNTAANYSSGRYTCMSDDKGDDRRFISVYDAKSELRVIGIEDYTTSAHTPDDYMDLLFVVKTTPSLGGGELPPIDPVDPKPEPVIWPVKGTLAFEDIWPNGGDYDLNDVIVEYNRDITIDANNNVMKIKEIFKPVQKEGSATQNNFFACTYKNIGKPSVPAGVIVEKSTNSVVIEASAKAIAGNSYVVERDLSGLNLKQQDVKIDFNPYIIAKNYLTENRIEIHLPKYEMTSAANKNLMNEDNAYYISGDGIYPFAIDIPKLDFVPAHEGEKIDNKTEYPSFAKWAQSGGKESTNWYDLDKGAK